MNAVNDVIPRYFLKKYRKNMLLQIKGVRLISCSPLDIFDNRVKQFLFHLPLLEAIKFKIKNP